MGENVSTRRLVVGLTVMFVLAGCAAGATPTPAPTPTPTAMLTQSPTPAPSATPGPTSAATPSAAPSEAPPAGWPYQSSAGITDALFGEDGRVVLAEHDGRVTVLDSGGSPVPGWPWTPRITGDGASRAAFGPDGSLYVAGRGESWSLHRLTPDGREMAGFPVGLPPMPLCDLAVNGDAAYVNCWQEDAETGTGTTEMRVVEPDGSTRDGWPVRMAGLFNSAGFSPDGRVYLSAWYGEPGGTITALASDGTEVASWPRKIGGEGEPWVAIDAQGRVRVTSSRGATGQCGLPVQTVYTMLQADGSTGPGWPVTVKGWSSEPELAADGTMVVASATGKVTAYSSRGAIEDGWPMSKVGVSVGCTGGSRPWAAGDGTTVVVGDGRATLLTADGRVASGWPVTLPYELADDCGECTPGPGAPLDPAVGIRVVYIGAYQGDLGHGTEGPNTMQPRVMAVERDGSMPSDAQLPIGKVGDTLRWLRIAPTGRVWALTVLYLEDGQQSTLYLVAEDTVPGP